MTSGTPGAPPRVALATASSFPQLDAEGPLLQAALSAAGVTHEVQVWDDPAVDWEAYDLVVLRSTWDYWERRDDFVSWARSVPRLANPADVVAWNTDKTYLGRLADAGLPVVPTTYVDDVAGWEPPDEPFVVKPTVSAGARDSAAYQGGDEAAVDHLRSLVGRGGVAMVQPYLSAVDTGGETAVLLFDGEVSHGARKGPLLVPGHGVDDTLPGRQVIRPREPSRDELDLARAVHETVRGWGHDLLYARVDMLPGPVLIELEVTEPSLMLAQSPGAADRFAAAVARWARR